MECRFCRSEMVELLDPESDFPEAARPEYRSQADVPAGALMSCTGCDATYSPEYGWEERGQTMARQP